MFKCYRVCDIDSHPGINDWGRLDDSDQCRGVVYYWNWVLPNWRGIEY